MHPRHILLTLKNVKNMKRNVIISGEFTINEVKPTLNTAAHTDKAQQRLEALRKAGIDTSCLFAMGEQIIRASGGIAEQVPDDDPIFESIADGGYVPNYKLFRRWVMAQMFRNLRKQKEQSLSLNAVIQNHGYEYQWRTLVEELRVQSKMYKHSDHECFDERNKWFNASVAACMCDKYIADLRSYVAHLHTRRCKGEPYKTVCGRHIFVSDLDSSVFNPLVRLAKQIRQEYRIEHLCRLVADFNSLRHHFRANTPMDNRFLEAYKGAGAYFTCKNLILFHGARFRDAASEKESLAHLAKKNDAYSATRSGWRLVGVMRQLLADSGISIEQKMAEWAK